tara:strand:- start:304 stop:576 length:273 start_codon:yes stop_codon:yes gene_type:complete
MSKIDLQQERESLKSTLFTEEINDVKNSLNTLHNNLMKLEDSLYKEGVLDEVNWGDYVFKCNGVCHTLKSTFNSITIIREVINILEKESR